MLLTELTQDNIGQIYAVQPETLHNFVDILFKEKMGIKSIKNYWCKEKDMKVWVSDSGFELAVGSSATSPIY